MYKYHDGVVLQKQRPIRQTVYYILAPAINEGFDGMIIAEAYSEERARQIVEALNFSGKGGKSRSDAKRKASAANGKKGGRPKKIQE